MQLQGRSIFWSATNSFCLISCAVPPFPPTLFQSSFAFLESLSFESRLKRVKKNNRFIDRCTQVPVWRETNFRWGCPS